MTKEEALQALVAIDNKIADAKQTLATLEASKDPEELALGNALSPYPVGTRYKVDDRVYQVVTIRAKAVERWNHTHAKNDPPALRLTFLSNRVKVDGTLDHTAYSYNAPDEKTVVAADACSQKVPLLIQIVAVMKKAGIDKQSNYNSGYVLHSRGKECRACTLRGMYWRTYYQSPKPTLADIGALSARLEPILEDKGINFTKHIKEDPPEITFQFIEGDFEL